VVLIFTKPNPHWLICLLTVPVINGTVINAPGIPARGFFLFKTAIKKAEPFLLCQYTAGSLPLSDYSALHAVSFSKCRCTMQFLHLDARTSEKPYQCDIKPLILQCNPREIASSHGLKHGVEVDSHWLLFN
jgi:hypothetical protein